MIHQKIKIHTKKHYLFYALGFGFLCLLILLLIANYTALYTSQKTFFNAELEQQSLSKLDLYHESSRQLVTTYFSEASQIITNLTTNSGVQTSITTTPSAALTTLLNTQRNINNTFDSLTVMNSSGTIVGFSTSSGDPATFIGANESTSPAFITGKADTNGPVIVNLHYSKLNRDVLNIAAQIRDKNNDFIGVVGGSLTLPSLAENIKLTSTYDQNFISVLTDSAGNILIWQGQPLTTIKNIAQTEPLFSQLGSESVMINAEEYNFNQQHVLARASIIDIGSNNLKLISFYNVNGFQQQSANLTSDISSSFSGSVFRDVFILVLGLIILWILIGRYERKHFS